MTKGEKMAKVIMLCGKICSGKSTYARKLRDSLNAVILSNDELMIDILGKDTGDMHDEYVRRTEFYFSKKAAEIVKAGVDVILDRGLWTKSRRDLAREQFRDAGVDCEIHYLNVPDDEWKRRIAKRNAEVENGRSDVYFIDDGLLEKFHSMFEIPDESEIDVWVESEHNG